MRLSAATSCWGLRMVMCVWEIRTCSFLPYLSQHGIFDLEGSVLKGRYCNVLLHLDPSRTLPHPSDVSLHLPTSPYAFRLLYTTSGISLVFRLPSRSLPLASTPLRIISFVIHCIYCLPLSPLPILVSL